MAVNALPDKIKAGWFASAPADTLTLPPDYVLFTVNFSLKPEAVDSTTFAWEVAGGMCEYAGYGGSPIYSEATFNDLVWMLP